MCVSLIKLIISLKNKWNLTNRCKKGGQELKQALLKKMWNQMGSQGLLGLKVLVMMTSLQNIVAQGLLILMGSKYLIKMTRPQKLFFLSYCFVVWSSLSKNLTPSTSGGLEHLKITMFCRGHHDQNFQIYQNQVCPFLYLGCFWLDKYITLKIANIIIVCYH